MMLKGNPVTMTVWSCLVVQSLVLSPTDAFVPSLNSVRTSSIAGKVSTAPFAPRAPPLCLSENSNNDALGERFGGYTVKQRLREEVESPFRQVRLSFFAFSTGSAMLALYFSALSAIKAYAGGFSDAPPLDEALTSCGINAAAAAICALLTYRDWKAGEANLQRIAKGGELARLGVSPASSEGRKVYTLKDYRRTSRVLIAAGGKDYLSTLARSLNSDQLKDANTIPEGLAAVDVVVVPVLLNEDGSAVGDTRTAWLETKPQDGDRNFEIARSNKVISFPVSNGAWASYLDSEIRTAKDQGFDVLDKGITITVKKNGKILRRTTGQPQWGGLLGTLEVMDGSKFGMPGDSERYGGP